MSNFYIWPLLAKLQRSGTGLAQPRGSERVKIPHHMDFYTKWHLSHSVKFWNQSHGVILNHSNTAYFSTYHKQNRWSHNLLSRFFSLFFCSCNRKHDTFSLFILARRISLLVNPIAINQDFNCTALLVKSYCHWP